MTTQPPATAGADDAPVVALPYRVVDREHTGWWWATAHAAQLRGEAAEPEVGSRRRPHRGGPASVWR